eukprot:gene1000-1088_t
MMTQVGIDSRLNQCLTLNPSGIRIFHPAFPTKVTQPLTAEDLARLLHMKRTLTSHHHEGFQKDFSKLPWPLLPEIGIKSSQSQILSKTAVEDLYEQTKHLGFLIWAHRLSRPETGCLLLNHWRQEIVFLSLYDPYVGAKGHLIHLSHGGMGAKQSEEQVYQWPVLGLEREIVNGHWLPVRASDHLLSAELLHVLPPSMSKALWELVLLCLLTPQKEEEELQLLLDTGLSPEKGLFAYIRLLNKVIERSELFDGVPEHLLITEREIAI